MRKIITLQNLYDKIEKGMGRIVTLVRDSNEKEMEKNGTEIIVLEKREKEKDSAKTVQKGSKGEKRKRERKEKVTEMNRNRENRETENKLIDELKQIYKEIQMNIGGIGERNLCCLWAFSTQVASLEAIIAAGNRAGKRSLVEMIREKIERNSELCAKMDEQLLGGEKDNNQQENEGKFGGEEGGGEDQKWDKALFSFLKLYRQSLLLEHKAVLRELLNNNLEMQNMLRLSQFFSLEMSPVENELTFRLRMLKVLTVDQHAFALVRERLLELFEGRALYVDELINEYALLRPDEIGGISILYRYAYAYTLIDYTIYIHFEAYK